MSEREKLNCLLLKLIYSRETNLPSQKPISIYPEHSHFKSLVCFGDFNRSFGYLVLKNAILLQTCKILVRNAKLARNSEEFCKIFAILNGVK